MANIKKTTAKKSKDKKKNIKKTKTNKPSYEPDVIEKDFCTLFSKEWTKNAAKVSGLMLMSRHLLG